MDPISLAALAAGVALGAIDSTPPTAQQIRQRIRRERYEWAWMVYLRCQPDWKPRTDDELVQADLRMMDKRLPPNWGWSGDAVYEAGGFIHPASPYRGEKEDMAMIDVRAMSVAPPIYNQNGFQLLQLKHGVPHRDRILAMVLQGLEQMNPDLLDMRDRLTLIHAIVALKAHLTNPSRTYLVI